MTERNSEYTNVHYVPGALHFWMIWTLYSFSRKDGRWSKTRMASIMVVLY